MKFKINKKVCFLIIILFISSSLIARDQDVWRVDNLGNLTVNGRIFKVKGASWTGLNGRDEPSDDVSAVSGVFMEMYIGNPFWAPSGRDYEKDVNEIKTMGFNLIRLPIVPQTLDPHHPQGRRPYLKNQESVVIDNARLALETVIKKLDKAGLYVLLDIHSCSNFVGWRAGRLDARPPYPDRDLDWYDFNREDCSCASKDNPKGVTMIQAYDEAKWLDDLKILASLNQELEVNNIMGINIFNEPWDYTWKEWRILIDKAYEAIDEVNNNILIFTQGVSAIADSQDGSHKIVTQVPHGAKESIPYRGENLYEAGLNPPSMPKNRLVFSPHCFGPSSMVQSLFMDPTQSECQGLSGDAAGDNRCNIIINPELLYKAWDEHFGYLKELGYAVVIGAWGGNPDWPDKAETRTQRRYKYISNRTVDLQWQETFVDYLMSRNITDTIYWSLNPESIDTGGIYKHAYDPINKKAGWGTWLSPDTRKLKLIDKLTNTTTPTLPPSPPKGDVNGDLHIDIVDALNIAQYAVGIIPEGFLTYNARFLDGRYEITIVDALMVAQYYVGLIDKFKY